MGELYFLDAINLSKAVQFAKRKHGNQLDDDGKLYINHPITVCNLVQIVAPEDINLMCAAVLHDTIEDTDTTYEELVQEFNQDIADLVNEVTHEHNPVRGYYFPRLYSQRGITLKFADRLSNVSRMDAWSEKRKAQYLRKSKFWLSGVEDASS